MPWYALHVRSNTEPIVEAALALEGISSFFPHQKLIHTRAKAKPVSQRKPGDWYSRPYFPGYVFVDADLARCRRAANSIAQVVRIVGIGIEAVAIPDGEIATVRRVIEAAEQVNVAPASAYGEGDWVIVKCGPLKDIEGRVVYLKNATRIIVAVSMLGQGVSAEVDASWLCPTRKPNALAMTSR